MSSFTSLEKPLHIQAATLAYFGRFPGICARSPVTMPSKTLQPSGCCCRDRREAHDLLHGHIRLLADTSHTRGELGQVRAEAEQFCDSSLMTEPTESRAFSVPRRFSSPKIPVKLRQRQGRSLSEVIEGHVTLSAPSHIPGHPHCVCFSQAACLLGVLVELLAGRAACPSS